MPQDTPINIPGPRNKKGIRVLLVDDHEATLMGLGVLLAKRGFEICGAARSSTEMVSLFEDLNQPPDVVTLDLAIGPGMDGYALCSLAHSHWPKARIIIYTAFRGQPVVNQATQAGAHGIVTKADNFNELVRAIELASKGRRYISAAFLEEAVEQGALSPRQREVLQLLADGATTDEVAAHLGIGRESVKTHVRCLLRKLRASDRAEAVAIGLRNALIR